MTNVTEYFSTRLIESLSVVAFWTDYGEHDIEYLFMLEDCIEEDLLVHSLSNSK